MSKELTPFESILKEKMSSYEAPYDIKSWYGIEKKMRSGVASNSPWIVAAVATFLVSSAIGFGIYDYRYSASEAMVLDNSTARFENNSIENIKGNRFAASLEAPVPESFLSNNISSSQINSLNLDNKINSADHLSASVEGNSNNLTVYPSSPELSDNASVGSELTFVSNLRQGCTGEEIEFSANNASNTEDYLWNFGDGRFSKDANPKHQFNKPGKYDVSLSVTSKNGQISTAVINDMIVIHPAPDADFKWSFINDNPSAVEVQILNTSNDANQYEWKFEDGSGSSQASPVKAIANNGKHTVRLQVSNNFGCLDDIVKQISINTGTNIGAANGFYLSEDGLYMPSALKNKDVSFEFSIYDMNDHKIYETKSHQKGWNGKVADGSAAPAGQYKWKVIIFGNHSEQKYFNGAFTVFP